MPRKGEVPKRKPLPDPKFTDQPVEVRRRITKFVNTVMESGKKAIAEGIVYGAFDLVAEKFQPKRQGRVPGIQVDNATANGELPASGDLGHTLITTGY